ncbi:MAG: hypothetical protein GY795_17040 [Desulfobacterales bacterium]|nr:hypothetical protein [Desulfobacterales bacterium]
MSIEIYSVDKDEVIDSLFLTGKTDYDFAISHFLPLINRLEIQRKGQSPKFYKRLEADIVGGCIMPPITLAFAGLKIKSKSIDSIAKILNKNINKGFILDGLQRMKAIKKISEDKDSPIERERPMFLNILICDSMDKLLYRMITLNNGQKPMTTRHQIEIIASNIYNFESLNVDMQTEKERDKKIIVGVFRKADFIKAYLSFLSKSITIDDTRIIEEKMNELIADKILQSNMKEHKIEFSQVVDLISRFSENNELKKWFKNENNLIGFCSAITESFSIIERLSIDEFLDCVRVYEKSFAYFDVSKIKVRIYRRKSLNHFIQHFRELKDYSETDLTEEISQYI